MKNGLDYKKISNVWVSDIDTRDYPDFVDAFIEKADYDGVPMTEEMLDELNEDRDFVYDRIVDQLV